MNIMPLLLLVFVWLATLFLLFGLYKSKLQKIYSDKGDLLKEKAGEYKVFPSWYGVLYGLVLVFFIGFFIFALFAFPIALSYIQKLLYVRGDTIAFIAPNTVLITLLPSLFLGMAVAAVLIKLFISLFPGFDQYQALKDRIGRNTQGLSAERRKEIWHEAMAKVNTRKLSLTEWQPILLFSMIAWLFIGPIYILAIDDYVAVKQDGIVNNPFVKFTETKYDWQDISKARIYANVSRDKDGWSVSPHFDVIIKDGKSIDVWGGQGFGSPESDSLIKVADVLHSNGVKMEVEPINNQQALNSYSDNGKTINDVFTHIESLNKQ